MIYCDLDGVLADFNKAINFLFDKSPNDLSHVKMWRAVESLDHFWDIMPKMKGADKLWNFLKPHNAEILTGCPKIGFHKAVKEKRKWVRDFLDKDAKVHTVLSINKPKFIKSKKDLLIDDRERNCQRWESAGGTCIRFETANQTIKEVKNFLL